MNNKLLNKKSTALEIKNLTKIIRNKKILDEVSFSVPKGSITIFVGENGAGKSTTIKCILDLFYYNSGEIKILGVDSKNPLSRKSVGYVPEKENFTKNSFKNFLLQYGQLRNQSLADLNNKINEYAKKFEIEHLLHSNTNIAKLSSGQKKKILIILSLLNDEELFIMDEPTDNLDPKSRYTFYQIIDEINKKRKATFFICSHNLDEVGEHANHAVFISNGKIIFSDKVKSKKDLVNRYKKLIISK
jgi:ABC-2 type transport system ATP-binding protein